MPRLIPLLTLASLALVSCQTGPQPRPFAGRGGSNLDQPPRYGDANRYVEPLAPGAIPPNDPRMAGAAAAGIDPRTIPPSANTTPPSGIPNIDQGLSVVPPVVGPLPGATPPATAPAATPPATATTPIPGDVPFARAVPGKPGYVFSPKDAKKVISVEGLRPGSKAKDPDTGEIFRVPHQ